MIIYRSYTKYGVFGDWYDKEGNFLCYSLEREWQDNEPYISCIPEGLYALVSYDSPTYGKTYALTGNGVGLHEGDRTYILIHPANFQHQLAGCIAPGSDYGTMNNKWSVKSSRAAMHKVFDYIESSNDFALHIKSKTIDLAGNI